jgi:MYXO-CTERM domain-containing protein
VVGPQGGQGGATSGSGGAGGATGGKSGSAGKGGSKGGLTRVEQEEAPVEESACGCRAVGVERGWLPGALLALGLGLAARRRRR